MIGICSLATHSYQNERPLQIVNLLQIVNKVGEWARLRPCSTQNPIVLYFHAGQGFCPHITYVYGTKRSDYRHEKHSALKVAWKHSRIVSVWCENFPRAFHSGSCFTCETLLLCYGAKRNGWFLVEEAFIEAKMWRKQDCIKYSVKRMPIWPKIISLHCKAYKILLRTKGFLLILKEFSLEK